MGISSEPIRQLVPSRFLGLNFMDQLRTVLSYYGLNLLILCLSFLSFLVLIKKSRDLRLRKGFTFLLLYILALLTLVVLQVVSGFSGLEWERLLALINTMIPLFIALLLSYLENLQSHAQSWLKKAVKLVAPLIIMTVMIVAIIGIYGYQPIVPSVKVDVNGVSEIVPVAEINNVNSAYQRYMILHAEKYISEGEIASDRVTLNQLIGLNHSFVLIHAIWYYPYSASIQENMTQKNYDYFLIHLPGKSGVFGESVETRSTSLILSGLTNSSIIYSNGESFICGKPIIVNESIG
jgi:hypothetical protein